MRYLARSHKIIFVMLYTVNLYAHVPAESLESLFFSANKQFKEGNLDQAIVDYTKIVDTYPQCHQAYFNVGLVYTQKGLTEQAIEAFQKATVLDPSYFKAYLHLGIALQKQQKNSMAIDAFKNAVRCKPENHEALAHLARAFSAETEFDQAITYFKQAAQLQPHDTGILLDLANTLNMNNHIEESLQLYYKLLELLPHNTSILYNIAYTLKKLNRIEEALPIYEQVLRQEPNHAEARFSLALAYLIKGDFQQGWPLYEWRWQRSNNERTFNKPLWDGTDLHGKRILLHAEQGLGDAFQFVRYARMAKEMGGYVIVAVHPPLVTLFSLCPYIDEVVSLFGELPRFDVHAPFMSVPFIVKTTLETIPHTIPYLYSDTQLTSDWEKKLSQDTHFKIGICWQGNSNYSTHFLRTAVAAKSIEASKFLSLLDLPHVSLYCLQKTTGEDQLKGIEQHPRFHIFDADFDNTHGRFMDTAAVMKHLDLMITVDTSIAHLAGGLGIPVWVLLPEPADWRWLLNRNDSPWYPTMRLFRQPRPDDWDSVLATIIKEVHKISIHNNTKHSFTSLELMPGQLAEKIVYNQLLIENSTTTLEKDQLAMRRSYLIQATLSLQKTVEFDDLMRWLRTIAQELCMLEQKIGIHEQQQTFNDDFLQLTRRMLNITTQKNAVIRRINEINNNQTVHIHLPT